MGTRSILVAALVLVMPSLAEAQVAAVPAPGRWVVYHDGDEETFSYDALTVRAEGEGVYRVWDRWSFPHEPVVGMGGEPAYARESLIVLDCNESRMMVLAAKDFDLKGAVLFSYTMPQRQWKYVSPDTRGELAVVKLCMALRTRFASEW